MGWMFWNREAPNSDVRDLERDPVVSTHPCSNCYIHRSEKANTLFLNYCFFSFLIQMHFQHNHYPILALSIGFLMPVVIAGLGWGDWLGGFLIAGKYSTSRHSFDVPYE